MAISNRPWDGAASRYASTDAYCGACLIDLNPSGADKTQANCKLPVYEPNGDLNRAAVHAAAAVLAGGRGGVDAPPAAKAAAARKLARCYRMLDEPPPGSLQRLAGG